VQYDIAMRGSAVVVVGVMAVLFVVTMLAFWVEEDDAIVCVSEAAKSVCTVL